MFVVFSSLVLVFSLKTVVNGQNVSNLYHYLAAPTHPYQGYGEGAIGGLIPTCLIILCGAIIRILQIYRQRSNERAQRGTATHLEDSDVAGSASATITTADSTVLPRRLKEDNRE
jgi:hypothetical protein